jgi:hypothetical protein
MYSQDHVPQKWEHSHCQRDTDVGDLQELVSES